MHVLSVISYRPTDDDDDYDEGGMGAVAIEEQGAMAMTRTTGKKFNYRSLSSSKQSAVVAVATGDARGVEGEELHPLLLPAQHLFTRRGGGRVDDGSASALNLL